MVMTMPRDLVPEALRESLSSLVANESGWGKWAEKEASSSEINLFLCATCYEDQTKEEQVDNGSDAASAGEEQADLEAATAASLAMWGPELDLDEERNLLEALQASKAEFLNLKHWESQQMEAWDRRQRNQPQSSIIDSVVDLPLEAFEKTPTKQDVPLEAFLERIFDSMQRIIDSEVDLCWRRG